MQPYIICLVDAVARNPEVRLSDPANFYLVPDSHVAIVGPNGAGKSMLVDTFMGKYPLREGKLSYNFPASQAAYQSMRYIAFKDSYGAADANYYYQQRWNSTDQENIPTVRDKLGEVKDMEMAASLFRVFGMESLLDKKIILLSSGELRKFQLIQALISVPNVLVMDNPFIGLDVEARAMLHKLLQQVSDLHDLQIILVISMMNDIPGFITDIVPVNRKQVGGSVPVDVYRSMDYSWDKLSDGEIKALQARVIDLPASPAVSESADVVVLNDVTIQYGERVILKNLNWQVKRGEKWALSGANGSGKSTLLSLIYADNPQSYACDISLFGRKRGTGESIWDIKKRIGYVSPEMHRAYSKNIPAIEIVASGLHDSIGLYKQMKPEQRDVCERWMDIFGIGELKDRPFLQLSSGEQRLTLLARAFVKDPELLILDEPLHGLDTNNRQRVKSIIEAFCHRKDKTVIMVTHYQEELPEAITHSLRLERLI